MPVYLHVVLDFHMMYGGVEVGRCREGGRGVEEMLQDCLVYLTSLRLFLTLKSVSIIDSLMVFAQQMHHISQTTWRLEC